MASNDVGWVTNNADLLDPGNLGVQVLWKIGLPTQIHGAMVGNHGHFWPQIYKLTGNPHIRSPSSRRNSQTHKDPLVINIICQWVLTLLSHNIYCKFNLGPSLHNETAHTLLSIQMPLPPEVLPQLDRQPITAGWPDWPIN